MAHGGHGASVFPNNVGDFHSIENVWFLVFGVGVAYPRIANFERTFVSGLQGWGKVSFWTGGLVDLPIQLCMPTTN